MNACPNCAALGAQLAEKQAALDAAYTRLNALCATNKKQAERIAWQAEEIESSSILEEDELTTNGNAKWRNEE